MSNIKFSQLPNLPVGNITASTTVPVVEAATNYTVTAANLQAYINNSTGNVTGGNLLTSGVASATGNVTGGNIRTAGVISATGNITGGNISVAGNVTGSYIIGNGSQLTNLPGVNNLVAGTGITVSAATGNVTVNTDDSVVRRITYSFANGTIGTATETISATAVIPANTVGANSVVNIVSEWRTNAGASYQRYCNVYLNTSNAISGNTIVSSTMDNVPNAYARLSTNLDVLSATGPNTRLGFTPTGSTINAIRSSGFGEGGSAPAPTYFTVDWTNDVYVVFTGKNVAGTGTEGVQTIGYQIYKQ